MKKKCHNGWRKKLRENKFNIYVDSVRFSTFKLYDLRILSERIACTTIITIAKRSKELYLRETIKEKTLQLPLR